MFNTILGIPAHPLLIHAAVIFIPLLIVGAIVYAAWPPFHPRITWAVLALAVIAPLAALFAKLSGTALKNRLHNRDGLTSKDLFDKIAVHNSYGDKTFWWTLALGILTLALLAIYRRTPTPSQAIRIGSTVVIVVVSAFVGYYVFKTGDTGAHIVWGAY